MIITIIIIPAACTPTMTTDLATIHRLPMTPTPMTAEDGMAEVMAADLIVGVGVMEAVEGIDSR